MPLNDLTKSEKRIVFECLQAVAHTNFIESTIFQTLMGITHKELLQIIDIWGQKDEGSIEINMAINNSLNNLTFLAPDDHEVWEKYISVSREEVEKIYYKWKGEPIPLPETWSGVVCGAISQRASGLWNSIDERIQNELLTHVWCKNCSNLTTITQFQGFIDGVTNQLTLTGDCIKCFNNIELTIDFDNIKNIKIQGKQNTIKREIRS